MSNATQQPAAPPLTADQRMQRLEHHAGIYSDLVLRQRYADAKAYLDLFCSALHPVELLCIQQAGLLAEVVRAKVRGKPA